MGVSCYRRRALPRLTAMTITLRLFAGFGVLSNLMASSLAAETSHETPGWDAVSAVFEERCIMCHSPSNAARGLRLDTYEGALAGSERMQVLVAGDARQSELVLRLIGESTPRMPFLSRPLPPEQIDLIVRWVDAGLPRDPATTDKADALLEQSD